MSAIRSISLLRLVALRPLTSVTRPAPALHFRHARYLASTAPVRTMEMPTDPQKLIRVMKALESTEAGKVLKSNPELLEIMMETQKLIEEQGMFYLAWFIMKLNPAGRL
jgi:hypothetical protein